MTGKFAGHVVVVTGAAQSLGLECARAFCSEGASVVLVDNNCEKVTAAAELLQRSGFRATATHLDVRSQEQTVTVVDQIFNQLGRLDVWVNNAGVAHHCDTFNLLPEPWQNSMDVLLSGPFYCLPRSGQNNADARWWVYHKYGVGKWFCATAAPGCILYGESWANNAHSSACLGMGSTSYSCQCRSAKSSRDQWYGPKPR